jgi:A/G-specific adenine glycosylase
MPTANLAVMRRRLLGWYETHKRDLPWRRTSDPYAIWVSETMLQQTQVTAVVPYYERFMKAFPDVNALCRAPRAKVLALWSGLGYYRRAENLRMSAVILARRYGGHLPSDYDQLRALPGVGEYTSGALLSIAFGKPYPAIDGNVRRVLSRIFLIPDEKKLREIAGKLVSRSKPGQFNQSLMELGSVLCLPQKPRCAECPAEKFCGARKNGHRYQFRPSKKRLKPRAVTWPIAIVRSDGKVLLHRREGNGVLAGLWEFPGGEKQRQKPIQTALREHLLGLETTAAQTRLGAIRHSITSQRIRAPVYLIDLASPGKARFEGAGWRWVAPEGLFRYPTSAMSRKALKLLIEHEKSHL